MKKKRILIQTKPTAKRRIIIEKTEKGGYRAALTEDGAPQEFMVQNADGEESAVGNIYVGIVESVSKNGFAFVDIGLPRNAFLDLNNEKRRDIKAGGAIAAQVTRDARGGKGANVTTCLSWPGRFLVLGYKKQADAEISVSKKITAQSERDRLAGIAELLLEKTGANISLTVRTDALSAAASAIEAEFYRLMGVVESTEAAIREALENNKPMEIYKPHLTPGSMMAAELMTGRSADVKEIVVNDHEEYAALSSVYAARGITVTYEPGGIFLSYDLEKDWESTKRRRLFLPSGGDIIIERTEACIVVDVNTGKYTDHKSMEEAALKVNIEAAREIAKQLRLRNLSGIIIIDFISMSDPLNVLALTDELKAAAAKDRTQVTVLGTTRLGLMELTRKRARNPLWT